MSLKTSGLGLGENEGVRQLSNVKLSDGSVVAVLFDYGSMDWSPFNEAFSIFDRLTGSGVGRHGINLNDAEMQPGDRARLAEIFRQSPSAQKGALEPGNPINLRVEYEFRLNTPSGDKTWEYDPSMPLLDRTNVEVGKGVEYDDLVIQQLQNSDFGVYITDRSGLTEFKQLELKAEALNVVVEYLKKAESARQASYLSLVDRLNKGSINYSKEQFQGTAVDWPKDVAMDYMRSLGDISAEDKADIVQGTTIIGVSSYLCFSVYYRVDGQGNHFTIRIPYSRP